MRTIVNEVHVLESAFVVLREAAELLLIVVAIHTFLHRASRADAVGAMWIGLTLGVVAGLALVVAVVFQAWGERGNAVLSIAMGVAVMAMAIVMLSSRTAIDAHVSNLLEQALEGSGTRWLVGGVAAFSAFRETAETGVFLLSAIQTHGVTSSMSGAVLGMGVAVAAVLVYRERRPRLPLMLIYRVSTLLLCLLSIQLVLDGIAALVNSPSIAAGGLAWAALQAGTREYYTLCAALMVLPLFLVTRRWWREVGSTP